MWLRRLLTVSVVCTAVSISFERASAQFSYPNFAGATTLLFPTGPYAPNDAQVVDGRLRLVPALPHRAGSAYHNVPQYIRGGFITEFVFQTTEEAADGIAFIIARSPGLGFNGGRMGYAGIPYSLVVEFDMWMNPEFDDPSDSHISVQTRWEQENSQEHSASLGFVNYNPPLDNGEQFMVRISYDTANLSIFVNDLSTPVLVVPVSVSDMNRILDSDGFAYVGFTAGTGDISTDHDILSWEFVPEPASLMALSAGLAGLIGLRRRAKR